MTNMLYLAQYQQDYSGIYQFTITHEEDANFRKYLMRKLAALIPPVTEKHPADAQPLDISLDDVEGDVVAGLSAFTARGTLHIDLLWVDDPMRGNGIGYRLVQMAEEQARERGCCKARISVTNGVALFVGMGYELSGTVQQVDFAAGNTRAVYWLEKAL
jgi:GNAT superfamily N-acetyltransferase